MTPETTALLAFDVNEVLRVAREAGARQTAAARKSVADAHERVRFEAAEYLVDRGNAAEAHLAAQWLLGKVA